MLSEKFIIELSKGEVVVVQFVTITNHCSNASSLKDAEQRQ